MAGEFSFTVASRLAATREVVWSHATTMAGVNRELRPLARMTHPRAMSSLDPDRIVLGERVIRSWILFLGFLPVDFDDLTFAEIEPGHRFLERSPMLSQKLWVHERCIESFDGGCIVEDRIRFTPRIAVLGWLQWPIFRFAFWLRHRNLRRLFGGLPEAGRVTPLARHR